MAAANNSQQHSNSNNNGLPLIPLSPIAQSFIICKNAINQASEKLTGAKKVRPHLGVDVLRGFLETVKLERHRLDTLTRKMQSVEAATALFWDSDALARQIAVIDCQLYSNVLLDKRSLSQLDTDGTKLVHLVDFHHYLTHSFAHQLIYWAELTKPENSLAAVVPPVHASKDSLITHLVRVAYLLLHAYRDFSGFAAIMKALTAPEVKRIKKLWQPCSSRTKDMFRDLSLIILPQNNYAAYYASLKTNIQHRTGSGGMMIAVPWIQPHLLSIRSIVTAYTAGDDQEQHTGDIVLSAPGAHKLNVELSILELCQHNSTIDASANEFEEIPKSKRASMAANKAIHIEGLRTAVIPVNNLNHLAPGDQLTHHWLVSRVYLRRDQLINESIEVEPLKHGESITCDKDEFEEAMSQQLQKSRPVSVISSIASSHHHSPSPPPPLSGERQVAVVEQEQEEEEVQAQAQEEVEPVVHVVQRKTADEEDFGQELVDIVRPTILSRDSSIHDSDSDSDGNNNEDGGVQAKSTEIPLAKPIEDLKVEEQHEVTLHPITTIIAAEPEQHNELKAPSTSVAAEVDKAKEEDDEDEASIVVIVEEDVDPNKDPLLGHDVSTEDTQTNKLAIEQQQHPVEEQKPNSVNDNVSAASSSHSSSSKHQKSRLSPTAPEFVPTYATSQKPASVMTTSTSADEKWLGYPVKDGEDGESEKWNGYPAPVKITENSSEQDDEDEVWKGYPGPNSSTDSPRRASSLSETSEEWKGYQATKMEADWQRESALKVQEHEWQGYALETLDEDELDSSTMMDGEFEKSRQARGRQTNDLNGFTTTTRKRHA